MKILWFTNTPCSATEKMGLESHRGGWLTSLENAVHNRGGVELHIAFYTGQPMAPFVHNKTNYYPLHRKNTGSKSTRYFNKLLNKPVNDEQELSQLMQVIQTVQPDLIHIHGTEENFGLLQYHTNIPVVISIQGALLPYSEKYFAGIPLDVAKKYEGIKEKIKLRSAGRQYKDMRTRAAREQKILRRARHIIGRTDWDRRITRVLAPQSAYYKNNEILRDTFYKKAWTKNQFSDTLKIVTISSDSLYKGFETIVNTARLLTEAGVIHFEWQVVGLNTQSIIVKTAGQWLKADYSQLHLQLLGSKGEKEIAQLLAEADVYCQVSHIENSPNSLCEALLMGMPVVASYAGGTASLLENGKEGVLVQDGDPYSLAGAITEVAGTFHQSKQYGEQARRRSLDRHDPGNITNDLVSIYHEIIKHHP
jgi:glycosyltransferase involved in cell wall biosynthesis